MAPRLPFPGESLEAGAAGPLAEVYLSLVQELTALQSQLEPPAAKPSGGLNQSTPPQAPPPPQMLVVLRQAREGLQDLRRLLSRP